jgi:hypothetical protein
MSRHLAARSDRTKKSAQRVHQDDTAAWERFDRVILPGLLTEAREFADEIWEIAEDQEWVHMVIAQRIAASHERDPDFGDLTPLRMRLVLHCVADDLAMNAPDRRRKV